MGRRASVRDANDNRSEYFYDGFDRLLRLTLPSAALGANAVNAADFEQYGYDANGNRTSLRLRSGETATSCFDNLNRETVRDFPAGNTLDVFSGYDLAGRRLFARINATPQSDCKNPVTNGQGVNYAYEPTTGRLALETTTIGTSRALSFAYDVASNRTRITWPDGFFAQTEYDGLNRVDRIAENGVFSGASLLADYDYDALSRRLALTRGAAVAANRSASTYGYDTASRLTALNHNIDGAAAAANDQLFGFGYTAASQMSSRSASNDNYNWVGQPIANRTYARNGLNQYTNVGGVAFAHAGGDGARGNLTSDGLRSFDYDLENRLIGVSGSASLALSYDPLGRLQQTVGTNTTQFLYDGDRLVAEYDPSRPANDQLVRRYVHGPGVDEPLVAYQCANPPGTCLTDRRYLITNHQGSVIAENGATTSVYRYGPYGEPDTWTGSRFRYTGQIALPEVSLYHYKARVYDPALGRFLQTDPVGYEDDLNLYAYVTNDPLNRSDPTGNQAVEAAVAACIGPQAAACAIGAAVVVVGGGAIYCATSEQCRSDVGSIWDSITHRDAEPANPDDNISESRSGGGRRPVPYRCVEPECRAPHGGLAESGRCPDCERKAEDGHPVSGPNIHEPQEGSGSSGGSGPSGGAGSNSSERSATGGQTRDAPAPRQPERERICETGSRICH